MNNLNEQQAWAVYSISEIMSEKRVVSLRREVYCHNWQGQTIRVRKIVCINTDTISVIAHPASGLDDYPVDITELDYKSLLKILDIISD